MKNTFYPSVSEILNKTKPKSDLDFLKQWKERVGEQESERISKESIERGIKYDQYVADFYNGIEIPHKALELHLKQYEKHSAEQSISSDKHGYYGRYDIVFDHKGTLCLNDFKGSAKPKREEWLGDYLLQVAAYTMALIENGVDIKYSMITIILDDDIQKFLFSIESIEYYFGLFLERLKQYQIQKAYQK